MAVTHGDRSLTWDEFDDRSARIAQALTDAGLGPDSKIALYMYNCNEYMEAHNAAFKMRGVAVNVNYRYLDDELWYLLDNSDSEALFFHSSLGDRVARVVDAQRDVVYQLAVEARAAHGSDLRPPVHHAAVHVDDHRHAVADRAVGVRVVVEEPHRVERRVRVDQHVLHQLAAGVAGAAGHGRALRRRPRPFRDVRALCSKIDLGDSRGIELNIGHACPTSIAGD